MIYSYWGHQGTFNQAKNFNGGQSDRRNSYVYPYWTPKDPQDDFAKIQSSDGGASYNVYRDLSFIRLANISLGYNVPQEILQKADIRNLKIYFAVKNAAFFMPDSKYQFWDPEHSGPTPRTFSLGINLTL